MCCERIYPDARLFLPYYCVFTTRGLLRDDNSFLGVELAFELFFCASLCLSRGLVWSCLLGWAWPTGLRSNRAILQEMGMTASVNTFYIPRGWI